MKPGETSSSCSFPDASPCHPAEHKLNNMNTRMFVGDAFHAACINAVAHHYMCRCDHLLWHKFCRVFVIYSITYSDPLLAWHSGRDVAILLLQPLAAVVVLLVCRA